MMIGLFVDELPIVVLRKMVVGCCLWKVVTIGATLFRKAGGTFRDPNFRLATSTDIHPSEDKKKRDCNNKSLRGLKRDIPANT